MRINTVFIVLFLGLAQVQCVEPTAKLNTAAATTGKDTTNQLVGTAVDTLPSDTTGITEDWQLMTHPRYLTGHFTAADHPAIVTVPVELTDGDGSYQMHQEALEAFKAMHAAAARDSIQLTIVSAFRNFDRQKAIWEAKWTGTRLLEWKHKADEKYPIAADRALAILRYSSMPGTSRHHWGTDIDLNNLNNSYFAAGDGLRVYEWLLANAAEFGFCQPYTAKGEARPAGYEEEKWHWSYLPLAKPLTDYAKVYLQDTMIAGFAGAEAAPEIEVVRNYVLGVNPACKE